MHAADPDVKRSRWLQTLLVTLHRLHMPRGMMGNTWLLPDLYTNGCDADLHLCRIWIKTIERNWIGIRFHRLSALTETCFFLSPCSWGCHLLLSAQTLQVRYFKPLHISDSADRNTRSEHCYLPFAFFTYQKAHSSWTALHFAAVDASSSLFSVKPYICVCLIG